MALKSFMCSMHLDMLALSFEVPLSPDYGPTIKTKLDNQRVGLAINDSERGAGDPDACSGMPCVTCGEGTKAALLPIEQLETDLFSRHGNIQSTVVSSKPNVNTYFVLRIKLPRL